MDINLIKYMFVFFVLFMIVIGSLVNWFEKYIPKILPHSFRYGKFAMECKPPKALIIVPKKWFKHFYITASLYSFYVLYLAIDVYLYGSKPPAWFIWVLNFFCGSNRKAEVSGLAVSIVLTLMTLQAFKRLYETHFVSVFSDSKMNISHYMVGHVHYLGSISCVLAEAEGFKRHEKFNLKDEYSISFVQIMAIGLFLYAWINQYKAARTLANLRKDSTGTVVTKEHKIPRGGMFEYVSSPHLFYEILIYIAYSLILFNNSTFKYVLVWVICNQMECALLSHWWYLQTFKNYPKNRKAIIPFVL